MNFDDVKNIDFNDVVENIREYFEELGLEGQIGWACLVLGIILLAVSLIL